MRRECLGIPDQEAAFALPALTKRLTSLLRAERPEVVLTHPYEGGHPDHDATAFATQEALRQLRQMGEAMPLVIEAAFYHMGPSGIETGSFLPSNLSASGIGETPGVVYRLAAGEQAEKRELLDCFATQAATLQCFGLAQERFRIAPAYDFSRPPHDGPAFYDRFCWSLTSARFCELATQVSLASCGQADALAETLMGTPCR